MCIEIIQIIISLIVLTFLELILSVDNILFISFLTENLQNKKRFLAKHIGIILAIVGRITLLFAINWLSSLSKPILSLYDFDLSIKDIIMFFGGIYLIAFSLQKILEEINIKKNNSKKKTASFIKALIIIFFFDSLFSFDSVLTAIAIGHNLTVMIIAVLISNVVLLLSIVTISNFIGSHPNLKLISLSFILLIGISLLLSGIHYNLNGFQIFIIITFAVFVQYITIKNLKNRINRKTNSE